MVTHTQDHPLVLGSPKVQEGKVGQDSALALAPLWSTGVTPTVAAGTAWGERAVPPAGDGRTTVQALMEALGLGNQEVGLGVLETPSRSSGVQELKKGLSPVPRNGRDRKSLVPVLPLPIRCCHPQCLTRSSVAVERTVPDDRGSATWHVISLGHVWGLPLT